MSGIDPKSSYFLLTNTPYTEKNQLGEITEVTIPSNIYNNPHSVFGVFGLRIPKPLVSKFEICCNIKPHISTGCDSGGRSAFAIARPRGAPRAAPRRNTIELFMSLNFIL